MPYFVQQGRVCCYSGTGWTGSRSWLCGRTVDLDVWAVNHASIWRMESAGREY
jgi:hypothetical protein